MKKLFATILIIAIVGSCSLFAASIVSSGSRASRVYDYLGFNIGFGITNESYNLLNHERTDKGYQLAFSVNDFTFFDKDDSVGLYIEAGLNINTQTDTIIDGTKTNEDRIVPFFTDIVIGFAFKADIDKKTSLLVGVGPDFMFYSKENNNYYWTKETWECLVIGAGIDVEGTYKVGTDVYIGVGFRSSFMFYGVIMDTTESWSGHTHTDYVDLDGYFGYRILPRFSVYLGV